MPRRFTSMRVDEVSSVDKGAGQGVSVVFMKRETPSPEQKSMSDTALLTLAKRIVADAVSGPQAGALEVMKAEIPGMRAAGIGYVPPDTRSFFLAAMKEGAAAIQKAGETDFQAFARYTADGDGRILLSAERLLAKAEMQPSRQGYNELRQDRIEKQAEDNAPLAAKAAEYRKLHPELSEAQSYARVMAMPENAGLVRKALGNMPAAPKVDSGGIYDPRISPGSEGGAPMPVTPSYAKLQQMADDLRNAHPEKRMTEAKAFTAIMETPAGAKLYRQHLAEQLAGEWATEDATA